MIGQFKQLNILIQKIPHLKNKDEIFDLVCRISKETESLSESDLKDISHNNNLYIDPIFNVFVNDFFLENLKTLLSVSYEDKKNNKKLKEQKQIVQLFLRISFFMVSVFTTVLGKETILFINQQLSSSIKYIYSKLSDICEIKNILFTLENTNFDAAYKLEMRYPVKLDIRYLNMNLISSRIITGTLIMNKIGYWILDIAEYIYRRGRKRKTSRKFIRYYIWNAKENF